MLLHNIIASPIESMRRYATLYFPTYSFNDLLSLHTPLTTMATPRKKISIHKRHMRHSTWLRINLTRLDNTVAMTKCQNCTKYRLAHRVCGHCGFYRGKQVLTIKTKGPKVVDA